MVWDFVQHNWSTIWRAALEILIRAVGIYYALRFVRGTRGAPVVTGFLVVLLALGLVSFLLKLKVLQYFLGGFSAFTALAVLVIFQPELRRILADVRIGALIAIEQSIQLREAVESSLIVDCEATPEMLETIFFPNNAIHDGGVIIKGDRISFAACIFPLTQRQGLNKSLGTRHRAAIGLSEETDAVVVAVSEETGSISHAYKGEFLRGLTLEELRAFLTSVIITSGKSRSWLGSMRAGIKKLFTSSPSEPGKNNSAVPAK